LFSNEKKKKVESPPFNKGNRNADWLLGKDWRNISMVVR